MKAGYQGKDEMRMRAEKAFGNSLKSVTEPTKKSKSHMTLENDKARLYKKGGSVKKCAMGGFQEKGGDPHFRMDGMKKGGKVKKMAMGGSIDDMQNSLSPNAGAMKKGGKVKKMNAGGMLGQAGSGLPFGASPGAGGMKKGGKVKKMAMGGVGKIRHKEATKSGMPIKLKKKKVMF